MSQQTESSSINQGKWFSTTFAALQYPNYRLWFFGQMVSLAGTWMQSTAQGYLVYDITNSTELLGTVAAANGLPTLLFMLFGGVIADRLSRRTLMLITQSVMMILAFILAWLTFTGLVQPWHIIVLAFLLGTANAFESPARVSFVAELVEREAMTNAIALNATMFNVATVVGPALSGLTYALVGPTWCFVINGLSFIAIIIALLRMDLPKQTRRPQTNNALADLRVGFHYVFNHPLTLSLTGYMGVVSLFGFGMLTLLPAWAKDILGGDETTNGWLMAARGLGALIGALMLATWGHRGIRGKLWALGSFILPVSLLLFAPVRWLPLSLGLLIVAGWSLIMMANSSNAMVQTQVSDELRGRVMGIYTFVFFGCSPLGAYLSGKAAGIFGPPTTVTICAIILFLAALLTWFFIPAIRRQP